MHSTIITIVLAAASAASAAAINGRQSGTCAPGTGYYQVCSNGFTGCCTADACGLGYCPGSGGVSTTTTTTPTPKPTPAGECTGTGAYYRCANNGFRGQCSVDPCAIAWCPDFTPGTCNKAGSSWEHEHGASTTPAVSTPTPTPSPKPQTVCKGTGLYYTCANNGFKGDCSVDPCALAWCPDYSAGTCTKAWEHEHEPEVWTTSLKTASTTSTTYPASTPTPAVVVGSNGVCPSGTGYFQVCSNGFKGCCKKDACAGPNPVCPY